MDWNSYFLSRSNQNFNFVPEGFSPANNGTVFPNNDQNWQYYGAYSQNFMSEPSTLQHVIPPLVSAPYGAFAPASRDLPEGSVRPTMSSFPASVGLGRSESFNASADALSSILSSSSLTPTAGEFVPRSKNLIEISGKQTSLNPDSQYTTQALSLDSQHQELGQKSVTSKLSATGDIDTVGSKKKTNNSKQFYSSNNNNSDRKDQSDTGFSGGNSESSKDSKEAELIEKSLSLRQPSDSNNSASGSGATKKVLNSNEDNKHKSDKNTSVDETKIVANIVTVRQGQNVPIRRGSGRILQSRGNENPRAASIRDSKSYGRQQILAQASSFYSNNSEVRSSMDKGNGSLKSCNEQFLPQRENYSGKNSRDQNERYFNNGKTFYKNNGKEDGKMLEGKGSASKDGGNMKRECEDDKIGKVERRERTGRNDKLYRADLIDGSDKQNRRDRQDRFDRQERGERLDRSDRQGRGDRQERAERQDRAGRREKPDRLDRADREDRNDTQDRADRPDRIDRHDRGDRQDRNNRQDRVDRQDRSNRQDRPDRHDRNYFQDRGDRQDRRERLEKDDKLDCENRTVRNISDRGDMPDSRDARFYRGDRSLREEKFSRDNWSDKGNRYRSDRPDRNNWGDREEKLDRGNTMDRGERMGKGDRQDRTDRGGKEERWDRDYRGEKNFKNDKSEQMDRSDGKQKTFFNSRFKNYDPSPNRREDRSDNFFENRGQKHSVNSFSQNKNSENKGDNSDYHSFGQNRGSPESSKFSNKNDNFSASKIPNGFDQDKGSVIGNDRNNSSWMAQNGEVKSRNLHHSQFQSGDDDVSQRERLSDQLSRGALECLVCCDRVRQHDAVWSCSNCYHVLHLRCIKKWAKSSKIESGWRCPACQNVTSKVPQEYKCFCGKMRDPEWNRQDLPHTCGEMCGRVRKPRGPELGLCTHRCTLLCHPGPCPPCLAQVNRSCGCGRKSLVIRCGNSQPLLCEEVCSKLLNCGLHKCEKTCHWGPCGDCEQIVKQDCFCGKTSREVPCTTETATAEHFSCKEVCGQALACTNHSCSLECHEGPCEACEFIPERVTHCPCGKTPLDENCQRKSCLDSIPTCGQRCGKTLKCGQPGKYHECEGECHPGPCPVCPLTTFVKCRCGHMDREIECKELTTKADDARCEKRCSKKRACGKHKCNQACCIDVDHECPLPCNHTLSCGLHKCEELCHRGHCQPCWRTSFEELFCECGANVIYPPVPCGTRRPVCSNPCSRLHLCEHQALHPCHSEPSCPPCTVLMERHCYGKHELRRAVPCHRTEFSCGMPCGLPLPCGRHCCVLPCHKGPCVKEGQPVCVQPCKTMRQLCGHPCAAPCHDGSCPDVPCKETVRVTCECGHRSTTRSCCDQTKEYRRVLTTLLASKMQDVQQGLSVDIGDLSGNSAARAMSLKTLDCNDECKIIERNRKLAIGLQIRNPDLSSKLQPRYSEFMRQWGKKDPFFVAMVHEKLTELVQLAKQSKQKSRSYSFSSMNREKRQFIHEYCEHFGCESQAYDPEPNRNVVATAQRDRAWLPSMSVLEVLQRESGQRKVPKPVTARVVDTKIRETVSWRSSSQTKSEESNIGDKKEIESNAEKENKEQEKKAEEEEIDYFEMTS